MNSKTDQVQAHRFMLGRLTSALLRVDPDAPESPLHRTYRGSTVGGVIAVVACLALLLFGLVSPGGNKSWKAEGTLVVVESTGARYLYAGGKLLPVLNYTSAKLVAGGQLAVKKVAEASLRDVPRGDPIGIIGAPDSVPALAADPWQVCTANTGGDKAGPAVLTIGATTARPLTEDEAAVVVSPSGDTFLLWRGQQRRVATSRGALDALDGVPQPVKVSAALLAALPMVNDFGPPAITGAGSPGPKLGTASSVVGRLYAVSGESDKRYVLTERGLKPLTELDFRLISADPEIRRDAYGGGDVEVTQLPGRVVAEHLMESETPQAARPPRAVSLHTGQGVCALVTPDGATPRTQIAVTDRVAAQGQQPLAQPGVTAPCTPVDRIAVRPGSGALVQAATSSGRPGGTTYLVTDTGVKYAVPPEGAKALGFGEKASAVLPTPLLALLPTGAPLDPSVLASGGAVLPKPGTCGS